MKFNGFIFLFFSTLLFVASSCSDFSKGSQLDDLKTLTTKIQKIEEDTQNIPTKELLEVQQFFSFHLLNTAKKMEGKEIDKSTAFLLDSCKYILFQVDNIQTNIAFIAANKMDVLQRIQALEFDIKEQTGNRKMYATYIASEKLKVEELTALSEKSVQESQAVITTANKLAPDLEKLTLNTNK